MLAAEPQRHSQDPHPSTVPRGEDAKSFHGFLPIPSEEVAVGTRTYKRRWWILLVFVFFSTMNNMTFSSFSPIAPTTQDWYNNLSAFDVNLLAEVFMISGFTVRFAAMWIIDAKGLGPGIFFAAVVNGVGCWVRYWPGSHRNGYPYLLTGQSICAVAQSFIDIAGPKIAANWFPPKERTTATAFAQGSIFIATLITYAVTPYAVADGAKIPTYLLVQASLSTAATILILVFFRSTPPMPPSESAAVPKMAVFQAAKVIFRNPNFVIMFAAFSITMGVSLTFSVLMVQIVGPEGYSEPEAGILGSVWIGGAIIGGALGGPFVDRTRLYKPFIICNLMLIFMMSLCFTLVLQFMGEHFYLLIVLIALMGLGGAALPAILEATIETIYPVPEATAMGILFLGLNISSIGLIALGTWLEGQLPGGSLIYPMYGLVALIFVAIVLVAFFKGDYLRLEFERQRQQQQRRASVNTERVVVGQQHVVLDASTPLLAAQAPMTSGDSSLDRAFAGSYQGYFGQRRSGGQPPAADPEASAAVVARRLSFGSVLLDPEPPPR